MTHVICNQAGSIPQCKSCSMAKPTTQRIVCPHGVINWAIVKFIGFLKQDEHGKYYVTLNGHKIPGLIPDQKYTVPKNVKKRLVFWVTKGGIVAHRYLMRIQKTH